MRQDRTRSPQIIDPRRPVGNGTEPAIGGGRRPLRSHRTRLANARSELPRCQQTAASAIASHSRRLHRIGVQIKSDTSTARPAGPRTWATAPWSWVVRLAAHGRPSFGANAPAPRITAHRTAVLGPDTQRFVLAHEGQARRQPGDMGRIRPQHVLRRARFVEAVASARSGPDDVATSVGRQLAVARMLGTTESTPGLRARRRRSRTSGS
jgi:hypothetical protein